MRHLAYRSVGLDASWEFHLDSIPTMVINCRSIALQMSGYIISNPSVIQTGTLIEADPVMALQVSPLKLNYKNGKSKITIQVSLKLQNKHDKAG